MDKTTKEKIFNLDNALGLRNFKNYHHEMTLDEYKNSLLLLSDDDEEIENMFFDLGLSIYLNYAVKKGLIKDVVDVLTDLVDSTEDLTGNDEDAVKEYKSLLDRIKEFL